MVLKAHHIRLEGSASEQLKTHLAVDHWQHLQSCIQAPPFKEIVQVTNASSAQAMEAVVPVPAREKQETTQRSPTAPG